MDDFAQRAPVGTSVAVTGASGFIGQRLVNILSSQGLLVRAISRRQRIERDADNADRLYLDISKDIDKLSAAFEGVHIVYHLAGIGAPSWHFMRAGELYSVNVVGTINVLEAARHHGVQRVVIASSAAVYGATDSVSIHEDQPLEPASPYGLAKVAQEQACEMYSRMYGLDTIALRLFNVYGAGEDPSEQNGKLIPTLVRCMKLGEEIQVFGDGQQHRDFVHVRDVARAFIHAGGMERSKHRVFNIGTGEGVSVVDAISGISSQLGSAPNVSYQPARKGETRQAIADMGRAHAHGFQMPTSFAEGIAEYRNDVENRHQMPADPVDTAKNE